MNIGALLSAGVVGVVYFERCATAGSTWRCCVDQQGVLHCAADRLSVEYAFRMLTMV